MKDWQDKFWEAMNKDYPHAEHIPEVKDAFEYLRDNVINRLKDGPQWVKGSERLPGMNKVVKWRNAEGGNIPLGENNVIDQYKKVGPNMGWHEWLDESGQRTPADDDNDPFIQKHLKIIMDKTLDIMIVTHIERMWGGLEMASVQHFVETGKVNGSLYLRIKELAMGFAERWHNTAKSTPADDAVEFAEWIKKNVEDLDNTDIPKLYLLFKRE